MGGWQVGRATITPVVEVETKTSPRFLFRGLEKAGVKAVAEQAPVAHGQLRGRRGLPAPAHPVPRDRDRRHPHRRRHVRGERQGTRQPGLAQPPAAVPGRSRRRRLPRRLDRRGDLHAPARGPRRVEHDARRRPMGADVPERPLPVRGPGVRVLAGHVLPRRRRHLRRLRGPHRGGRAGRPRAGGPPARRRHPARPHAGTHARARLGGGGVRWPAGGDHWRHDPHARADRRARPVLVVRLRPERRRRHPAPLPRPLRRRCAGDRDPLGWSRSRAHPRRRRPVADRAGGGAHRPPDRRPHAATASTNQGHCRCGTMRPGGSPIEERASCPRCPWWTTA